MPAYDDVYYQGNDQSGDRIALAWYARITARLAPRGARVLDFGSGTGHFSRRLAERYESFATDLSPYAREQTARTSPKTTVLEDLGTVAPASLGVVCTLHVLEHIPEPAETLATFAGLLRPGGRLLYVVPDPEGQGHRIKGEKWFAYRDDTHCSLLSTSEWLATTERQGFRIDRAGADGLWDAPYVPRVPTRLQLGVFGLPAAAQVALGRLVLPLHWGECLVVIATRA